MSRHRLTSRAILVVVGLSLPLLLLLLPYKSSNEQAVTVLQDEKPPDPVPILREFLAEKGSPLAEHTELILEQKHWRLLIAISHIESQFCKRQLGYNCWGIGGDSAYRYYDGYPEAIKDANDLIERWQSRGKWLTVAEMNGSYVQPANPNWESVVNKTLKKLEELIPPNDYEH